MTYLHESSEPVPLGLSHPARYSAGIMEVFADIIERDDDELLILDLFAGTGKIHEFRTMFEGVITIGVEIEAEWAAMHMWTHHADATNLPRDWTGIFDMVITSPAYGNRFSDHHNPKDQSRRRSYTFDLRRLTGDPTRQLDENNTGRYPFSHPAYKQLHKLAWQEVWRVLKPKGRFILNVSDFISKGSVVEVCKWHKDTLVDLGFDMVEEHLVETQRLRYGTNHAARVASEYVYVFVRS